MAKATGFDEKLHAYLAAHRSADDPILLELREETERALGPRAIMQVAPEQGTLLGLLVAALGVCRAVEVGTFTGYSALCMARSLPPAPDGKLICCDLSEEWTGIGRKYWERAGVADRIDLRIGPALDTLRSLPQEECLDFAFIDADKTGYQDYYEEILPRLYRNCLIAVDNVLWGGSVIGVTAGGEDTQAIRAFNDRIVADERVQSVMVAISDGLTLIRKL